MCSDPERDYYFDSLLAGWRESVWSGWMLWGKSDKVPSRHRCRNSYHTKHFGSSSKKFTVQDWTILFIHSQAMYMLIILQTKQVLLVYFCYEGNCRRHLLNDSAERSSESSAHVDLQHLTCSSSWFNFVPNLEQLALRQNLNKPDSMGQKNI